MEEKKIEESKLIPKTNMVHIVLTEMGSISGDVNKIKELHSNPKPDHLSDEQWQRYIQVGNEIIKNIL